MALYLRPWGRIRHDDPFGVFACHSLALQRFECVRFQFPAMEEGRRRPDTADVAEAAWRTVIGAFHTDRLRTVIGGRSFDGRMASHVVAAGIQVDALALFAYPLLSSVSLPPWLARSLGTP